MKCPYCSHVENKVIDSRDSKEGDAIRRRRECLKCSRRFTTYEFVEEMLPVIIKKDGRREPYDRLKILNGLKKACEKRPISTDVLEKTVDAIEKTLQETCWNRKEAAKILQVSYKALLYKIKKYRPHKLSNLKRLRKELGWPIQA